MIDYEQRYNDALDRAKKLKETCDSTAVIGWCEYIFPELKENAGEKIREAIIHFISHTPAVPKGIINKEQMLAWLEKQGEMNIQNNNPLKIEPDKFYFCIKDYFAGGCYRSKKGDVVLAQNGMNMMGLSPKQASEYFMPINPFKEHVVVDWLEKQGKHYIVCSEEQMKVLDEVLTFAANHESPYWNYYIFGTLNHLIRQFKTESIKL